MDILHVYDENDTQAAHYVAVLTKAMQQLSAIADDGNGNALAAEATVTMRVATNAKSFDEQCKEQRPDIVHLHAMAPFTLPAGHRLVLTPHGRPIAAFVEAYAIVARSPLEYNSLKETFLRVETVRNPLITRTTTDKECARQMLTIYQRVMDSYVLELMNEPTRQLMAQALAAAIGGDRRWAFATTAENNDIGLLESQTDFRKLYIYTELEGVADELDEGLRILGTNAPQRIPVVSYLPTDYRKPEKLVNASDDPTLQAMSVLSDVQRHGPSLLRLTEMARVLRNDQLDEGALMKQVDEQELAPLLASLLQLLSEQVLLTEGFMPCAPADTRQTAQLRIQLATRQKI